MKSGPGFVVQHLPQLVIAGSFIGSALAMKLAPLAGLAPAWMAGEIVTAYKGFAALQPQRALLDAVGMGGREFMLALAVAHCLAAALLMMPEGAWPARCAGFWAMVAMAGAEYCTRTTAFVFPGTPPSMVQIAAWGCSFTHLFLFVLGAALCFRGDRFCSLGGAVAMKVFVKDKCQARLGNNEPEGSDAYASIDRGRPSTSSKSRARDQTPPPRRDKSDDMVQEMEAHSLTSSSTKQVSETIRYREVSAFKA